MKISVVMPSFNQAEFLPQAIDSVLMQEGPLELIVQDGGSTDGSVEILKRYEDRIIWESGKDGGQSEAINKGLKKATGEILCYLNSDDVFLPGAFKAVREAFSGASPLDFAYGQADFTDTKNNIIRSYPTIPFDYKKLLNTCFICQPACFWKRDVYEKIGGFNEKLHYTMDYEYWLRGHKSGLKFFYLTQKLAQSRYHASAKSSKARVAIHEEAFEMLSRYGGPGLNWIRGYATAKAGEKPGFFSYTGAYLKATKEMSRRFHLNFAQTAWILLKYFSSYCNKNRMNDEKK